MLLSVRSDVIECYERDWRDCLILLFCEGDRIKSCWGRRNLARTIVSNMHCIGIYCFAFDTNVENV